MHFQNIYELIINFILPAIVFTASINGNLLMYIVLSNKKLKKIGPIEIYRYLCLSDFLFVIQIIATNLQLAYKIDVTLISNISCKVW
jgi:hypothetical protein